MIHVALKEWKLVCDLLAGGEMALLVRKGGIHEAGGPGEFELEHDRFALFATWEHQDAKMLKAKYRGRLENGAGPGPPATAGELRGPAIDPLNIPIEGYAEVVKIWEARREAVEKLDDLHCWSKPYVDMRYEYRPDRPVYLVVVRAYRLREPKVIKWRSEFAGCVSWVPLNEAEAVDETGAEPAMSDAELARVVERVERAMGP